MSEFLAEAAVLIQANTRAFRAELAAALATVPKSIEIPVVAVGTGSASSARRTAKQEAATFAAASGVSSAALQAEKDAASAAAVGIQRETAATKASLAASRSFTKNVGEVRKGLVAQAASAAGLRGAIIGANSAFIVATASAIAFGKAVQGATQFQTELATFGATTGATADQLKAVSAAAKQLGADVTLPGVSAQDAAVAMTELSKAGLNVQNSIAGARGVLQLATAAQIDNAAATELSASALNSFGLSGEDAVHVADVLANAANDAQGSITDIGIALQQASAAGRQAGLSLEQTTGILTIFARNGIKGSDAGTLLRTMLIRLINPTDKAQKVIDKLGLHLRDATGGINLQFFDEFAQKTSNLTKAERDRDAAIIAGQDAFRGLSILAREGGAALDSQVASLDKAGTAAQLAAARTSGLAGASENLKNQLANLGLTVGGFTIGPLTGLANALGDLVKVVDTDINLLKKLGQSFIHDFPALPTIKLGPIDTSKADKSVTDFVKRNAPKLLLAPISPAAFVQNVVPFGKVFDALNGGSQKAEANLDSLIRTLQGAQGVFGDTSQQTQGFAFSLVEFGKKFTQTSAGVKALQAAFSSASPTIAAALEDGVITPAERAVIGVDALGQAFLSLNDIPVGVNLAQVGANIRSGIEDAVAKAKSSASLVGPALTERLEAAERMAAIAAGRVGTSIGEALKTSISDAIKGASAVVAPSIANLQLSLAQASGNQGQELSVLRAQQKRQQEFLTAVLGREQTGKNVALATKAANNLQQTNSAIEGILSEQQAARDKIVSDAKSKASAAKAKADAAARTIEQDRQAADQKVFDSLTGGQNRINLAQIDANATARLSDDIAVQRLIANTASREIALIDRTVKDVKTRNAAIASRVAILKAAGAELDRLRKEQADTAATKAQSARDLVTSTLEKKLQLAQIIGNKDPILAAFNALIANERKNLAAAKKADKLDALIKLRQTIKDRNDFMKDIQKDAADGVKQGTTAFDLLKEFADTFNQNAGNLINQNQPFAGPTGFTADIAQFLIRRQPTAGATTGPVRDSSDKLVASQSSLTDAINKLRDSFEGSVPDNTSTSTRVAGKPVKQWHNWNWAVRQFQEG